jgi:multidrug efflux pump subunit AcrA (membrane-fusion protein)
VRASVGERALVLLAVLPLLAAAAWLIVLRRPNAAVARMAVSGSAARAEMTGLGREPSFVGVVVAGQDAELGAELAAEVVEVFQAPGARVHKGDRLLQLQALSVAGSRKLARAQALEDRSALTAASLALDVARDQLERMQNAPSAYSARDLLRAKADAARASAEVARLRGSAAAHRVAQERELSQADKLLVRAPFDGVLASRPWDAGDFVNSGQILARVVDDERFVRFALPADHHSHLRVGAAVRVVLDQSDLPLSAAVVDVDPELDAAAGLGFARARFTAERNADDPGAATGTRVAVYLTAESQP